MPKLLDMPACYARLVFDEYDLDRVAACLAVINPSPYESDVIADFIVSTVNAEFYRYCAHDDWKPPATLATGGWRATIYPSSSGGHMHVDVSLTPYTVHAFLKANGLRLPPAPAA